MARAGMVCRQFGFSAAGLCLAVLASAGEQPQPSPESGLAEIKHDYEALKSARAPSHQSALAVPVERAIDMKSGDPGLEILPNPAERLTSGKKSAMGLAQDREKTRNWLIDGVAAQDKASERARSGDRSHAPIVLASAQDLLDGVLPGKESNTSDQPAAFAIGADAPQKERGELRTVAVNPLAPFMSLWMRSDDFELLAAGPTRSDGEIAGPVVLLREDTLSEVASGARTSGLGFGVVLPEEGSNPYLPNVQAELTTLGSIGQAVLTAPAAAPAVPKERALVPPPSAPTMLSEQLKARDDTRYFKQLKRF